MILLREGGTGLAREGAAMRRLTAHALVVAAAGMLALPASGVADSDLGPGTKGGHVPRVISLTPMKPISFAAAKRRQAAAKRTGRRPRGPVLATTRGLSKVAPLVPDGRGRTPSGEAQDVPIDTVKPTGA